ncbi:ATP-binding cassette domain-containing protein [Paenibacillus tepidiphilus]|uniref:ATP-binding cassette domain-containing protein n=1 Tax=Paenibacillus tepidiphilus TaxID=2608683 RepID=UPI00123C6678|nr:ATP-binding cassette domain-containing protein [Paenibacillus tepidiphilus]
MSLRTDHLDFGYEAGYPVLRDIQLEIKDGTLTVLCGVTGSGKSTLLRLLAGLYPPAGGTVERGTAAPDIPSLVFQQPETQLFTGSVHKEIEYGLGRHGVPKEQRKDLISRALERVGLPYGTFAERSPFLLSGGEQRRLCIACALAVSPGLLLLDEPTAGLDPQAAQALLQLVQELRSSGVTIVVSTHDLDSFLHLADQVIVMKQGAVHYDGPAAPLLADARILSAAGLEPPAWARIAQRLVQRGRLERMPAAVEELLADLAGQALPAPVAEELQVPGAAGVKARAADPGAAALSPSSDTVPEPAHAPVPTGWRSLDPRVKWLGMALGSLTLLGMRTLLPLLLTAALIALLLRSAGIPRRRVLRFFRPFVFMFLFIWIVSGMDWSTPDYAWGPLGFSLEALQRGGLSVLRFLLLLALGFLFTETTTGAPLREGLEWAIAPLRRLGVRTRNWSLAVTVTLQFVPWILDRLGRLQLALSSRGPRTDGRGHWNPRQITMLMVPMLIMAIAMGDELSTAVESRGYDPDKPRSTAVQLNWRSRDTAALLIVVLTAAGLWWCSLASRGWLG